MTNRTFILNILYVLYMGQISQPMHKNAADGENRDNGPFRWGPI